MPILIYLQQEHGSRYGSSVSIKAFHHGAKNVSLTSSSRAPFTYSAWKSPEVLARISEVAGIDLVPFIDFEIANINISIRDENSNVEHTVDLMNDKELPAVAWHYDSFPFVCVTMLSDCTGMVGGETALRTPSGEVMKVRGPAMVSTSISRIQIFKRAETNQPIHRALPSLCKDDTSSTRP